MGNNFLSKEEVSKYKNSGYCEVPINNVELNERVLLYIQISERGGGYGYGWVRATCVNFTGFGDNKRPEFRTDEEHFTGTRWTKDRDSRKSYVLSKRDIIKPEEEFTSSSYTNDEKKELNEWYNSLSYGNRRAVDLITSGRCNEV